MAAGRAGIPSVCTSAITGRCATGEMCSPIPTPALFARLLSCRDDAMPAAAHRACMADHVPVIPYMRANLRRKQASLAGADAIVAVSHDVAAALRERAPELARARIEVIPNGVDVTDVARRRDATPRPISQPYALFVGKLAKNKGVHALGQVAERAVSRCRWWSLATVRSAHGREGGGRGRPRRQNAGLARPAGGVPVAGSRGAADFSVDVARASEPCVDRSQRAVGADRGDEHRWHVDIIVDEETGLLSTSPESWRKTSPGSRRMPRFARASARRQEAGRSDFRHPRRDRSNGSALRELLAAPAGIRMRSREGQSLRVAVVARSVYPLHRFGGLERHVYDLVRCLLSRDVQITLITPPAPQVERSIFPQAGVFKDKRPLALLRAG